MLINQNQLNCFRGNQQSFSKTAKLALVQTPKAAEELDTQHEPGSHTAGSAYAGKTSFGLRSVHDKDKMEAERCTLGKPVQRQRKYKKFILVIASFDVMVLSTQ